MARVIVIVGLILAITAGMFAITRKSAVATGEAATEARTTVQLDTSEADNHIDDVASPTSAAPRESSTGLADTSESTAASAQEVAKGSVPGAAPSFGTAGIDDKGNASFTGTAAPGDSVTLVLDGKSHVRTKADEKGNWSVDFKAPKSESQVQVSAQSGDGAVVVGPQKAVIRPAASPGALPHVTLKLNDEAAGVKEDQAAEPEVKTGLIVEKVEGGADGQATLSGKADAGASVKASINGRPAGETEVAGDGTWMLAAANASKKSANNLRLELVDQQGATLDKVDVPYKIAAQPKPVVAETVPTASASSVFSSKPAKTKHKRERRGRVGDPVTLAKAEADADEGRKATIIKVRRGDSLWRISRRHLGNGKKWAAFYKANKAKIDNPDLIYPGQTLILPG